VQKVRLRGTDITDAGLEHLQRLPDLRRVDLASTRVSDAGVEAFRSALPDARISR
jgi:hypothetical protein